MKQQISALTFAATLLVGSAAGAEDFKIGSLTIDQPWARASVTETGAAYMTITNNGTTPDELVSAAAPVAGKVELHTHIAEGDVMRMRPVGEIDIGAGQSAMLKPGGLHIMLMGLKTPLKEGETFPLTLTFKKAGEVTVDVPVQAAGASAPEHMGGHMK